MHRTFILAGVCAAGLLSCTDKAPPAAEQTTVAESPVPQNETRYVTDQFGAEYFERDGFSPDSELKRLMPVGAEITVEVDENGRKITHPKLPGFVGARAADRGSVWIREDRLAGSPPAPGTRGQAIVGDYMFTYPLEGYRVSISRTAAGGLSLGFSSNGGEAEISAVDAANPNGYDRNLVNPGREFLVDYPPNLQERRKVGHDRDIEVIIRHLAERNEGVSEMGQRPDVLISTVEGDIVFSFYHVGRQDRAVPLFEEIAADWERLPVSRFFQAVEDNDTETVGKILHVEDDATVLKREMTKRLMWLRRDRRTALYTAAAKGFTDMAQLLIDAGAPLERGYEYHVSEDPPLSAALAAGREETARLLIDKGASRDGIYRGGRTILTRAIRNEKTEMVRLGLSLGLNPDTPDAEGDLPLFLTYYNRANDEILDLLIGAGCDVNIHRGGEGNFVHFLIGRDEKAAPALMQKLLDHGFTDINGRDDGGRTPLILALGRKNRAMAELLLSHNADVRPVDNHGDSALSKALENDYPFELVERIVLAGADVKARDEEGDGGYLDFIAANRSTALARLFIKHGAAVDTSDRFGITPLIRAVAYKRPDMVRLLVEAGADVNRRDKENRSALDRAVANGQAEIVKFLKSRGAR
jgi:ankyrin repeat protein